jgi:Histidine kinase-, DNA gyrase B-, and HSP90-like ATPase
MGDYAKLIADLKLVKELKKSAGRDDIPAQEIEKLVALVNHVADVAGPLLERIPVTFKQYTEHNILHCKNLVYLMGRFIPCETLRQMNGLELSMLILSAMLHDFGMFVSEDEKRDTLKSPQFESFLLGHHDRATALEKAREKGDRERAAVIEDALLAEYFRRMHPERARENVRKNLAGRLTYGDVDISPYVLDVCESHAWGVHESNDPKHPEKSVISLSTNRAVYGVPLNLQYIACCLRLADIMDFDRSRTPLVVFQNIDFTEEKSWEEWNKHLSVIGWKINDRDVTFRTECKHPAFYVAVMEFLDWVDSELAECHRLVVKEAPRDIADRYKLHLPPVVDRSEVEMEDKTYLAGAFRFQLEYARIMALLMDKSLYPDPSLFLRELLQNSLDACRNREAHAKEAGHENFYNPRIAVWDYSDDSVNPRIVFQDNGMGMSRKIVENYFMRVGRSYYRSPEFDAERARLSKKGIELEASSQFGIGILSCFMVADHFEVETYRTGHRPLHITIEGPTKYFVIKLLDEPPRTSFPAVPASDDDDGPPCHPGTRITVHLRPNDYVEVYETLKTFAANVEYDILVYQRRPPRRQTIPRRKWESERPWLHALTGAIVRQPDADPSKVVKNFSDVLAPSLIPLNDVDLSPDLRGSAWLWLLQDEGLVCPQRGYLRMTAGGIVPVGLPAYISHARWLISYRQAKPDKIIKKLQTYLALKYETTLGPHQQATITKIIGKDRSQEAHKLVNNWNSLSPEERGVFHEAIGLMAGEYEPWYGAVGIAKQLLSRSYGWVSRPLRYDGDHPVRFKGYPADIALHGVLLPAGLLWWNPMDGNSGRLALLTVPGGAQLDVRGHGSPTPAASRLFVDSREAGKVLIPLTRLVLRHALGLPATNSSALGWDEWIDDLLGSIKRALWYEAVIGEWEMLQNHLKYRVKVGGEVIYMSRQEVIQKFGRWAPVSGERFAETYNGRDGLDLGVGTTLLLTSKDRRRAYDGSWEVDMNSNIRIQREALQEHIDTTSRMRFTS